jgi:hypothetical protein
MPIRNDTNTFEEARRRERDAIVAFLIKEAAHWREERRLIEAKRNINDTFDGVRAAEAKCAALEKAAADIQDGVHTR